MKIPHPIPYQGSKRNLAKYILPFFPLEIKTLFEPFSGSAAISIAAAVHGKATHFHLNDVNQPLIALWNEIINNPKERYSWCNLAYSCFSLSDNSPYHNGVNGSVYVKIGSKF